MKLNPKQLAASAALLGVLACSARPVPEAALDRQTRVALPAPWPAPLHYRQQLLTVALPGSSHDGQSLMTVLTVQPQGLRLQGLTPLGVPLFRIDYDAAGINSSTLPGLSSGVGAMPPAAQVLADVMLAYWPLASWQARLPAGNRENYSRVPQDLSRQPPDRLQIDQKRKRLEQFLTACVHFAERSLTFLHRMDNIKLKKSALRQS